MIYRIVITDYFKKQIKKIKKKDRFIMESLNEGFTGFEKGRAVHIGRGLYKIRLGGGRKGKSGGYRCFLYLVEEEGILAPVCIYSKNVMENLPLERLALHMENVRCELEGQFPEAG